MAVPAKFYTLTGRFNNILYTMRKDLFQFELPDELIAAEPTAERTASRLLALDKQSGELRHGQFVDLLQLLQPGDLLVFNNTRVIPARLWGEKSSGGKIEVLIERITGDTTALAHIRASKSPKPGAQLNFDRHYHATMVARHDALFELHFNAPLLALLDEIGHMPLPPYIERDDTAADRERYQTVYAQRPGAVAAPTAGLHFDQPMLNQLAALGVESAFVTLHVGAGTFQPVRSDDIAEHKMHSEWLEVSAEVVAQVARTKAAGGRVVAVGTTSVRSLESAAWKNGGELAPYSGETDIFIYPGFEFKVIDALITNFHLSESTLIMLVSALAGREQILHAYQCAVAERYRFFSYGDAMFIGDLSAAERTLLEKPCE